MRAIYLLLILLVFFPLGCTTIEVAKEVTKVTTSVKKTIEDISENNSVEEKEQILKKEKEEVIVKKKKEKNTLKKQKTIASIKLIGETIEQLTSRLGGPELIRVDGNTKMVRFDADSCRLFVYFDLKIQKPKAKYYEIRNPSGVLLEREEKINKCFKEILKV